MSESLTPQEVACLLRAARRQREALTQARARLILLDSYTTHKEHQELIELDTELKCMERAISWLWQHR